MHDYYLTKSDFKVAQTCPTKLYYRKCGYPTLADADEQLSLLADQGYLVEALAHIARFGSDHTEVIATEDAATAEAFVCATRSSAVMVNASSRFNDGGQLGLGAEIGISTTRLHAYGPMGVESLTIERFVVRGAGQVRHPR